MSNQRYFALSEEFGLTEIIRTPRQVGGVRFMGYMHQLVPKEERAEVMAFVNGEIVRDGWKVYKPAVKLASVDHKVPGFTVKSFMENVNFNDGVVTFNPNWQAGTSKTQEIVNYNLSKLVQNGTGE